VLGLLVAPALANQWPLLIKQTWTPTRARLT
jgi:hypothetical protein